jgi:hypothetical protein
LIKFAVSRFFALNKNIPSGNVTKLPMFNFTNLEEMEKDILLEERFLLRWNKIFCKSMFVNFGIYDWINLSASLTFPEKLFPY